MVIAMFAVSGTKTPPDFTLLYCYLVTDKTINVLKLGLGSCWFRHGTKACMAVPATGPVAENVYSVTVECSMKFALDTGSIRYVLSVSLPLVVIRGMKYRVPQHHDIGDTLLALYR